MAASSGSSKDGRGANQAVTSLVQILKRHSVRCVLRIGGANSVSVSIREVPTRHAGRVLAVSASRGLSRRYNEATVSMMQHALVALETWEGEGQNLLQVYM